MILSLYAPMKAKQKFRWSSEFLIICSVLFFFFLFFFCPSSPSWFTLFPSTSIQHCHNFPLVAPSTSSQNNGHPQGPMDYWLLWQVLRNRSGDMSLSQWETKVSPFPLHIFLNNWSSPCSLFSFIISQDTNRPHEIILLIYTSFVSNATPK